MTPISTHKIEFQTLAGNVIIIEHQDGGWVFEFTSGWCNGLHCDVPFQTFDKCYTHIKSRMPEWKQEMKYDNDRRKLITL